MNRTEILAKLEEIFKDLLDEDDFTLSESDSSETIREWDSLFHITLVASVEDEFKIRLATADIAGAKDVGALIDIIEKELSQK